MLLAVRKNGIICLLKVYFCLLLVFHLYRFSTKVSLFSLLLGLLAACDDPGEEMGPVQKGVNTIIMMPHVEYTPSRKLPYLEHLGEISQVKRVVTLGRCWQ